MSFPVESASCSNCRGFLPGYGFDFSYRFAKYAYVDSVANLFPGSSSSGQHGGAQEGLVGLKLGRTFGRWGLFTMCAMASSITTRHVSPGQFLFVREHLALRSRSWWHHRVLCFSPFHLPFQCRHYGDSLSLQAYTDPKQPPTSVLSTQYYSFKGSLYLSSGYVFRF